LLYAGTTLLKSFKYYILNYTVKILKIISKSAGNCFNSYKVRTSETLRDEITTNAETINNISVHVPKHLKPANDVEFGHYLAGLIDGDGHFSSKQQLIIVFNILDVQLAYYVKKKIGYGNVRKIKNKNAVLLIIANLKGIEKVISLINCKFRTTSKYDQIIKNILAEPKFNDFNKILNLTLNTNDDLENH
jgi:hypothetical protein